MEVPIRACDDMVIQLVVVESVHALTCSFGMLVGAHACMAMFTAYLVLGGACCGRSFFDWPCTCGFLKSPNIR